ncbi:Allantoicase [Podila epigama]|nr:Allantoicase [Podila epigama]
MGQVQSRQHDETFFKLDVSDRAALEKKYIDLASSGKGGKVLKTTDELFGEGFHLIKDGPAIEDKNRETANGFWKDGWETRRHNKNTHHSAIIQLACAGTIAGFDVDTSFFDGSHPSFASIDACLVVKAGDKQEYEWKEILPKIPLNGNSHHYYGLQASDDVFTHIRLNMYPDGGIARLRVFGNVSPIFPEEKTVFNLASLSAGAIVVKSSDDRYGQPSNIILPTDGVNTRDGWQTRRSRVEGHVDWVEIKLGAAGLLEEVEVDLRHFSGNNPDFISLDACHSEYRDVQYDPEVKWVNILPKTTVQGDKKNNFTLTSTGNAYTHVRLNIYPDGGISRLRVYGVRVPEPIETEVVQIVEAVDDLKVIESAATSVLSTASADTLVEGSLRRQETEQQGAKNVAAKASKPSTMISEVSSVSTLVESHETQDRVNEEGQEKDEEEEEEEEEATAVVEPVKKVAKRGRPPKNAATIAATATLAAVKIGKKKTKGRSASVMDEEDYISPLSRTKRARE